MSEQPTVRETPPADTQKAEVNQRIRRLGAGATVLVRNEIRTRRLTVERRVRESCDTPDWTSRCLGDDEVGQVLSGYGTTYLLVGHRDRNRLPSLSWPSCRASGVWDVVVEEPGEVLSADQTAMDLLGEVGFDGR